MRLTSESCRDGRWAMGSGDPEMGLGNRYLPRTSVIMTLKYVTHSTSGKSIHLENVFDSL
jgi:hypothetical protein